MNVLLVSRMRNESEILWTQCIQKILFFHIGLWPCLKCALAWAGKKKILLLVLIIIKYKKKLFQNMHTSRYVFTIHVCTKKKIWLSVCSNLIARSFWLLHFSYPSLCYNFMLFWKNPISVLTWIREWLFFLSTDSK